MSTITKQMIQEIRAETGCSLLEARIIAQRQHRELSIEQLAQRINLLSSVTVVEPDRTFEIQEILQDMLNLIK